jgi:uncharacterized protein YgiB involved in biofilm formation
MLKKLRKSSGQVTLVLIGVAALAGCSEDGQRRDVYATREDCLADWGNKPQDCTPATETRHRGFYYGPYYGYSSGSGSSWNRSSSSSRSIGSSGSGSSSSSVSRGGFGSSSRSSSGG